MTLNYHFVAFVDVLGFAEMVRSDCHSGADEPKIYPLLKDALSKTSDSFKGLTGSSVKQFSDSIVISITFDKNPVLFRDFCLRVGSLQCLLFDQGILTRGGIAYGKHFENEDFVFSQAVVNAYRIESELAIFPRIVISTELTALFGELGFGFIRDRDNQCFLDYLTFTDSATANKAVSQLVSKKNSPRVAEKIRWLSEYVGVKFSQLQDELVSRMHVL